MSLGLCLLKFEQSVDTTVSSLYCNLFNFSFLYIQVLLPELALLRLVVFDSDHVFIGQRVLPVNQLRAGFRHVSLRDKHNTPLGIANLFLHIKIEDYVPDEYEGEGMIR